MKVKTFVKYLLDESEVDDYIDLVVEKVRFLKVMRDEDE